VPGGLNSNVVPSDHMRSSANGGTVRGNPEARRPSKRAFDIRSGHANERHWNSAFHSTENAVP
jgi:hypothetical protein